MIGELKPFNTIGPEEIAAATDAMKNGPLSGFLGGIRHGGYYVEKLEHEFASILKVRNAIATNSATSGLLMACMAAGVGYGDEVVTTPFTMSATAAAPAFIGAEVSFGDIEEETFCLDVEALYLSMETKAIITTNLFGHPSALKEMMHYVNLSTKVLHNTPILIEDNAQSPFSMEYGSYAGTIGHIGVFSGNVHKALQCGEGGICVTNDDDLAEKMRMARNHGEMAGGPIGLNLRLSEVHAAIWLAQLEKREEIISSRIALAEYLTDAVKGISGLTPPVVREGCKSVFYCWALKIANNRDDFVQAMQAEGVPLRAGYVPPLYRLPAFQKFARPCPVAERMHDKELVLFEICAYDPTHKQLEQIKDAFHRVAERVLAVRSSGAQ